MPAVLFLRRRKIEVLYAILAVQFVVLLGLSALLLRRTSSAADPRAAELGDKFERLDAALRDALAAARADALDEAARTRNENAASAAELRKEVLAGITTLGSTLGASLNSFREDNKTSGDQLRRAVEMQLDLLAKRLSAFTAESGVQHTALRESLNAKVTELTGSNTALQERLRKSVEDGLGKLNTDNAAKLEEMRATVDEKLHATLQSRLTESFGQVTDQLTKVHAGLGEMSKLSAGVDDLSRIFTNVKSRGGFAEVQLGMLLRQMLAPGQFIENAPMRPGSLERVEYAIRFPTSAGERLMPIDAKFPREDWERLEAAYAANIPEEIAREGRAFESALRTQAEKICSKYINPPVTTPYAIMFLPTEGLYAEVIRREALQSEIQSRCHVTIAGPTTLSAILTSFQMGFHMLALQEKGDEVWKVLESAKQEFGKFGKLMDKVEGDVGKIQKSLGEVGVRTRAINRTLREVSDPTVPSTAPLEFEDFASPNLSLAASVEED
jgi:DNA recombination protein RmuC